MLNEEFLSNAEKIIRQTGDFIREQRLTFSAEHVETKGKNDLVSYVDRQAEEMLVEGFEKLLSGSGFILEEGGELNINSEWRWIIDPLDGTTNFMHGVPAFAVSVALQQNEKSIAGWVLDVMKNELFHAVKGRGAFREGLPISVSPETEFSKSLLATGFPYSKNPLPSDYLAVLAEFVDKTHGVRRFGAAALDLVWVACGMFEGFYEVGLRAWDVAAGSLILEEAGGKASDFEGGENYLFGRQMVASNGHIHRDMVKILSPYSGMLRN